MTVFEGLKDTEHCCHVPKCLLLLAVVKERMQRDQITEKKSH